MMQQRCHHQSVARGNETGQRAVLRRSKARVLAVKPQAILSFLGLGRPKQGAKAAAVQRARDELMAAMGARQQETAGSAGAAAVAPTARRVSELVDELSAAGVAFDEKLLGGGPWVVRYTKGAWQLWDATSGPARVLDRRNAASQDLNPATRTLVNRADYWVDRSVYVTASGTYEPEQPASSVTPVAVTAYIREGQVSLFGLSIPLPIRGTGQFEVMYLDRDMRIFRSGTSYSVQVRPEALQ